MVLTCWPREFPPAESLEENETCETFSKKQHFTPAWSKMIVFYQVVFYQPGVILHQAGVKRVAICNST